MPFVPGQLILCVSEFEPNAPGIVCPDKGIVYTVRDTGQWRGIDFVRLHEVTNGLYPCPEGQEEPMFESDGFRPIDDKALDIFRQVLTDAPKDVETV